MSRIYILKTIYICLCVYVVHSSQRAPISVFGENVAIGLGNLVVLFFYRKYTGSQLAALCLASPVLLSPLLGTPRLLALAQSLSIPLYIVSRIPQLMQNYR